METGGRVLIVEDDSFVADCIAQLVRPIAEPLVVATARDGIAALTNCNPWRAAILDLGLPDGSALDILSHAATIGAAIPAIVVTGADDPQAAAKARSLGAHYMLKPLDGPSIGRFVRESARPRTTHALPPWPEDGEPPSAATRLLSGMADAGVADLQAQYAIGLFVHRLRYPAPGETHGPRDLVDLATRLGMHPSALRRRARVCELIQPQEFAILASLRNSHGLPLTWSHLEQLAMVRGRSRREAVAMQIIEHELNIRQCASLVRTASRERRRGVS